MYTLRAVMRRRMCARASLPFATFYHPSTAVDIHPLPQTLTADLHPLLQTITLTLLQTCPRTMQGRGIPQSIRSSSCRSRTSITDTRTCCYRLSSSSSSSSLFVLHHQQLRNPP